MVSGEEIINSMKAQMEEYKKQFDEVSKEIDRVGVEYQTKIDELQQERVRLVNEGNAKLDELKARREQISGMHSALFQQCNQFEKPEEKPEEKSVSKAPKKKIVEKIPTGKSQEESLTDDDLAKLKEISNPEKVESVPDDKDIPDYLKDSYKK